MVKDRLPELREKSLLKDEEFELDQKYEKATLLNQKQILSDLSYFGGIFSLINDLRRNIREIEMQIINQESLVKDDTRMDENANLCFKIFTAVKGLQAEMDKTAEKTDMDALVCEVRRVQYEGVQRAYIEAYWEYDAIVRRYEDEVAQRLSVASDTVSIKVIDEKVIDEQIDSQQEDQPDETSALQTQLTSDSVEQAEEVLDQLNDRNQELAALEKSLLTMRNLFVLFSTLVMEHGSILNLAEEKVQVAVEHVAVAAADVKDAAKYYHRTNSLRCWCIDVMTILSAILGLLLAILCWMIVKKFLLK